MSAGGSYRINDLELASRLSFFLWSSSPTMSCCKIAAAGKLRDPQVLRQQVQRMLADKRSSHSGLQLRLPVARHGQAGEIKPDVNSSRMRGDLRRITSPSWSMFVDSVFREDHRRDGPADGGLHVSERAPGAASTASTTSGRPIPPRDTDDSNRFGLLGKGAVLMVTSYPNRTAPVLRGAWMLESITGTPPAAPPPNVPPILKDADAGEKPQDGARADGSAPQAVELQRLPRHDGSARLGARELQRHGRWRKKDRSPAMRSSVRRAAGRHARSTVRTTCATRCWPIPTSSCRR